MSIVKKKMRKIFRFRRLPVLELEEITKQTVPCKAINEILLRFLEIETKRVLIELFESFIVRGFLLDSINRHRIVNEF